MEKRANLLKEGEDAIQAVSDILKTTELSDDALPNIQKQLQSMGRLKDITKHLEDASATFSDAKEMCDKVSGATGQLTTWVKEVLMSDVSFECWRRSETTCAISFRWLQICRLTRLHHSSHLAKCRRIQLLYPSSSCCDASRLASAPLKFRLPVCFLGE